MNWATERPNTMKLVEHSARIDFSNWNFGDDFYDLDFLDDARERWLDKALKEFANTIKTVFQDHPPTLSLPFQWSNCDGIGGPRPTDPLTLHVELPLCNDECESVVCAGSLEGAIDDLIELHEANIGSRRIEDEGGQATAKAVADRLRQLADKLEAACAMKEPPARPTAQTDGS